MEPLGSARVDSWTWGVRMFKTRSQATAACRAGHVKVNGERAKSAQPVRVGDEVRVRSSGFDRVLVVAKIVTKRVGAPVAAECFVDMTPPPPPREEVALLPMRDRGAGRPTKRERREIDRLRAPEQPARYETDED
ncbi:RNA-binding S4 domain-containing protein [Cryobacterium sp. TMT1-21]|uniref:RNA-binding S4 domain-containing protein n=1 Tax=Cryobacterium shii TaxID=1259235 RepID=A0AAQ2C8F2_9MICO|nr:MULTISPECIES: RNA-binding S4 domain-containing protein [Cryobacterium]TFC52081.1 RNA-binding S4 domain-containing protein [Cryobacterium shii]TFC85502.1 RNA-binding S4 domain-containing protein [Cryobacterium sp. TmT2-59]TFD06983.1 RNA-binding S4 domain-containing protein [Cryobacterium sp. TMT1-21]TFD16227.1 RNA-binding S4 domain-containing protein [Cryobacterium sp. TMT2-23]TFD19976.1 RNA-binding S4 domain-containing protein [Cryobacterium sp. TMT4-10]